MFLASPDSNMLQPDLQDKKGQVNNIVFCTAKDLYLHEPIPEL